MKYIIIPTLILFVFIFCILIDIIEFIASILWDGKIVKPTCIKSYKYTVKTFSIKFNEREIHDVYDSIDYKSYYHYLLGIGGVYKIDGRFG